MKTERIPRWEVRIIASVFSKGSNPIKKMRIEAHTGPVAEQLALANHPGWRVLTITRISGYESKAR